MHGSEYGRFREQMEQVCSAFGRQVFDGRLDAYWRALQGIDLERVETACAAAISELDHMPTASWLKRRAFGVGVNGVDWAAARDAAEERDRHEWVSDPIRQGFERALNTERADWLQHRDDARAIDDIARLVRYASTRWGEEFSAGRPDGPDGAKRAGQVLGRGIRSVATGILRAWQRDLQREEKRQCTLIG